MARNSISLKSYKVLLHSLKMNSLGLMARGAVPLENSSEVGFIQTSVSTQEPTLSGLPTTHQWGISKNREGIHSQ